MLLWRTLVHSNNNDTITIYRQKQHLDLFYAKAVLKHFCKFLKKIPVDKVFLLKRDPQHSNEIFKNTYFGEHLRTTAFRPAALLNNECCQIFNNTYFEEHVPGCFCLEQHLYMLLQLHHCWIWTKRICQTPILLNVINTVLLKK